MHIGRNWEHIMKFTFNPKTQNYIGLPIKVNIHRSKETLHYNKQPKSTTEYDTTRTYAIAGYLQTAKAELRDQCIQYIKDLYLQDENKKELEMQFISDFKFPKYLDLYERDITVSDQLTIRKQHIGTEASKLKVFIDELETLGYL